MNNSIDNRVEPIKKSKRVQNGVYSFHYKSVFDFLYQIGDEEYLEGRAHFFWLHGKIVDIEGRWCHEGTFLDVNYLPVSDPVYCPINFIIELKLTAHEYLMIMQNRMMDVQAKLQDTQDQNHGYQKEVVRLEEHNTEAKNALEACDIIAQEIRHNKLTSVISYIVNRWKKDYVDPIPF